MKHFDYYFIIEFQWNEIWYSHTGLLKPVIYPTSELSLLYGNIDYSIIASLFVNTQSFQNYNQFNILINDIKISLLETGKALIANEIVNLEMTATFCLFIDNIDMYGTHDSPNWNNSTKVEVQQIPTHEILEMLDKWLIFLKITENLNINNAAL